MRKRSVTVLVAICSLVAGCGDDSPSGPSDTPDYFPMEQDDWWVYAYSAERVAPDSAMWEQGEVLHLVTGISGDTCTVTRTTSNWMLFGSYLEDTTVTVDTLVYLVTADSVWLAGPGVKVLDLPLELGKTWGGYTVTDMDASVETPAGLFTGCAEVQAFSSMWDCNVLTIYCPSVGEVARLAYGASQGPEIRYDIKFELQGSSR